jgi:hypothetical protein
MSLVKRALELGKTDPLRKRIEDFLSNKPVQDVYSGVYEYVGKSKKIKSSNVTILEDLGESCRVVDEENNITTVKKTMLR